MQGFATAMSQFQRDPPSVAPEHPPVAPPASHLPQPCGGHPIPIPIPPGCGGQDPAGFMGAGEGKPARLFPSSAAPEVGIQCQGGVLGLHIAV